MSRSPGPPPPLSPPAHTSTSLTLLFRGVVFSPAHFTLVFSFPPLSFFCLLVCKMKYKISINYFGFCSSGNVVPAYSSLQFTYVCKYEYVWSACARQKPVSLVEIGAWPNRLITVIELYTYIHTDTHMYMYMYVYLYAPLGACLSFPLYGFVPGWLLIEVPISPCLILRW